MKKTLINTLLLATLLTSPMIADAQIGAKLNGLKEKVTGKGDGGSESKGKEGSEGKAPKLSEEDKDKADTTLDGKEYTKDDRGINGIYYSTETFHSENDLGTGVKKIQKFLLEYVVDEANKNHYVKLSSRYAFEESNRAKFVAPIKYGSSTVFAHDIKAARSSGILLMGSPDYTRTAIKQPVWEKNLQDKWVTNRSDLRDIPRTMVMVEPGIFLILNHLTPFTDLSKDEYRSKQSVIVLYKPEKEEEAKKYTGKFGHETAISLIAKYDDALDKASLENNDLPKPAASFKEEPTNAALVEAVKKRMAEMPYYKGKNLVYVYNVAPWEQKFENVGLLGRTLTYRQMQVIAVFKDGNKCQYSRMLIRQDNSYVGGTAQEKWTGNILFCNGDQHLEDIGCDKAMKYKK